MFAAKRKGCQRRLTALFLLVQNKNDWSLISSIFRRGTRGQLRVVCMLYRIEVVNTFVAIVSCMPLDRIVKNIFVAAARKWMES